MVPEIYYLQIHLAQVSHEMDCLHEKVKNDLFENKKLIAYISTLNDIVAEIRKTDFASKSDNDKEQIRYILLFMSVCVQYIKSATINDMKSAVYVCLRAALEDWVKGNPLDYVVTTYKGNVGTHHYQPWTVDEQSIKAIYDIYSISFTDKLVSLAYPSYLEKDFLSNVSLYHELGHFIDLSEWGITARLTNFIIDKKCLQMQDVYFKNVDTTILYDKTNKLWPAEWNKLHRMLCEYFADIFAVQYIGRHKIHLSQYIAGDNGFDNEHPSTEARTIAINNFLGPEANNDDFIKQLRWATNRITGRPLKQRNIALPKNDLLNNQPCSITDKHQLHTLLQNAWEIWEASSNGNKMYPDLMSAYGRMNSLLEQSIMNFENNKKIITSQADAKARTMP